MAAEVNGAKAAALAELGRLAKHEADLAEVHKLARLRLKAAVAHYGPRGIRLLELPEMAPVLGRHLTRASVYGRQVAGNWDGIRDQIIDRLGFDPLTDYRHPDQEEARP